MAESKSRHAISTGTENENNPPFYELVDRAPDFNSKTAPNAQATRAKSHQQGLQAGSQTPVIHNIKATSFGSVFAPFTSAIEAAPR